MKAVHNRATATDGDHPALTPALRCWPTQCACGACAPARVADAPAPVAGEPRDGLRRYALLVPEAARDGVAAMLDGLRSRMDFDASLEDAPEMEDLMDWAECVVASARRNADGGGLE